MRFFKKDDRELMLVVQRFAAGSVFLWFGVDKWVRPESWYGWVPGWVWPFVPDMDLFMYLNGAFEVTVGVCMVTGRFLREVSIAAFLFLLGITLTVGVSEVTIRDLGLMGIFLSLVIHADATARRRLPPNLLRGTVGLYVAYLFIYGVLYLRETPIGA